MARIANQREDYPLLTLKGLRPGARLGYSNATAGTLARLEPQELEDMAHFIARFPPAAPR